MDTQIQMLIRDMLFINYAVDPDRLRPLVPEGLALDLVAGAEGKPRALVSAVAFRVADVRSNLLPLPRLSFDQISYRTYVNAGEGAGIYFFEMRINSRLVTAATSFLRLPINYEEIEIITAPAPDLSGASGVDAADYDPAPHTLRCAVTSSGSQPLAADVLVGMKQENVGASDQAITPGFITERPVGYIVVGDGLYKIEVEYAPVVAFSSRAESLKAHAFVSMGLLNLDETTRPHSVLYVQESLMNASAPSPKK